MRFVIFYLLLQYVYADHEPIDGAGYGLEQVYNRPGNVRKISTTGTATEDRDAVQTITLSLHQVLDMRIEGTVTGGDFAFEFCDFDLELPGYVQYAGTVGTKDQIVVVTNSRNLSAEYFDFGVPTSGQYPVRISTTPDISTQQSTVYVLDLGLCPNDDSSECELTLPLQQLYKGKSITLGDGRVWGCSWRATNRLQRTISAASAKTALDGLLGAGVVRSVTKQQNFNGAGSFRFEIKFESGVTRMYGRIDDFLLRGNSMLRSTTQLAAGYPPGTAFNLASQGWGGTFKLAMQANPTVFSDAIAPQTSGPDFASIIRKLPDVDGSVTVSKASNGMSWSVTFPSRGFVPTMLSNVTLLAPYGALVAASHKVVGLSKLGGQFELAVDWHRNGSDVRTTLVDHAASQTNMVARLSELGFTDTVVTLSGPDAFNGYSWLVTFFGNCPTRTEVSNVVVTDTCSDWLLYASSTAQLTGNDAAVAITEPSMYPLDASDLELFEDSLVGPLQWDLVQRVPATLGDPVLRDPSHFSTTITFPDVGRGSYTYTLTDLGTGEVVGRTTLFTDSRRPHAIAGDNQVIAFPISYATLIGSTSESFYSSSIASYSWSKISAPSGASSTSGQVIEPFRSDVVISNLNTPGTFTYRLVVTDTLGHTSMDQVSVTVLFAPVISSIPDQSALPGANVTMRCTVTGSSPMTLQWHFNGVSIDGKTKSTLNLNMVSEDDQGNYTCSATNQVRTEVSNIAFLSILDPPRVPTGGSLQSIRAFPTTNPVLVCNVEGTMPINYFWQRTRNFTDLTWHGGALVAGPSSLPDPIYGLAAWNEVAPVTWETITSQSTSRRTLTLYDVSELGEAVYRCVATNVVSAFYAPNIAVVVEDAPTDVHVTVDPEAAGTEGIYPAVSQTFELTCNSGSETVVESYKWYSSKTGPSSVLGTERTISFSNVTHASHTAEYWCTASNFAGISIAEPLPITIFSPPVIVTHPQGGTRDPGANITLEVVVNGLQPFKFFWSKDGQYLPQNILYGPTLLLDNIDPSMAGEYRVVVENTLGSVQSGIANVVVTLVPVVVSHPMNTEDIDPGQPATFMCQVNGTQPIAFRWLYRKDVNSPLYPVIGANEAKGSDWTRLEFSSVSHDSEADYYCEASNSAGSTLSNPGKLYVSDAPSFVDGPNDTFVDPGDTATLRVVVQGAEPMTYQWRKDGVNILDQTTDTLTLTNVQLADEATYDCRVSNRLSTSGVLSRPAILRIAREPTIVTHPSNSTGNPGTTMSVSASYTGAPELTVEWLFRAISADPDATPTIYHSYVGTVESESTQLTFTNATEVVDGYYSLRVTNRLGSVTSSQVRVRVNDPPVIESELITLTVDPGDPAAMDCTVSADPRPDIYVWSHRPFVGSGLVVVQTSTTSSFVILSATQSDEGTYYCYASNQAGTDREAVVELVVRDPPTIIRLLPDVSSLEGQILRADGGQSITLSVEATGLEPISFEWFLDGISITSLSTTNKDLVIPSASAADEGRYTVFASNPLGSDTSSTWIDFALNVPASLFQFRSIPLSGRVIPLDALELQCVAGGSPPFTFEWSIEGTLVTSATFPTITISEVMSNTSSLFIPEATDTIEGQFECRVRNSANPGGDSGEMLIEVLNRVVLESTLPADTHALPGESATLTCEVLEGSAPFEVSWFRGDALNQILLVPSSSNNITLGKYVGAFDAAFVGTNAQLIITDSQEDDEDEYSCQLCNELGCSSSRRASFSVHNRPVIVSQFPTAIAPSVAVNPHTTLNLEVLAVGMEPLSYHWSVTPIGSLVSQSVVVDGTNVYFAPSNCEFSGIPCKLVFSSIQSIHAGNYSCTVSNPLGSIASVPVQVSVNQAPALSVVEYWPSVLKTACPGDAFRHSIGVIGTRPMTFKWYFSRVHSTPAALFSLTSPYAETMQDVLTIQSPTSANAGFYGFIATNIAGSYTSQVAKLEVNNGPQAAADATGESPKHAVTLPQTWTQLSGQASSDSFSTIVTYQWSIVSSPFDTTSLMSNLNFTSADAQSTLATGLTLPGQYVFQLRVINAMECTDTDTVHVTVNQAPVPVVRDIAIAVPAQKAILDASRSYDPDSDDSVVSYTWKLVKANGVSVEVGHGGGVSIRTPSQATTELFDFEIGTYEFELTIVDSIGAATRVPVFFTAFAMSVLSPTPAHNHTFTVGTCQGHTIQWTIEGGLNGDTRVELWLVEDNESKWRHQITSGTLGSFELYPGSIVFEYNWVPDYTTPTSQGETTIVEVVIPIDSVSVGGKGDQLVRASSGVIEMVYPFHFRTSTWSQCDASVECSVGTQRRNVQCVETQRCASLSTPFESELIQQDAAVVGDILCKRFATTPAATRTCYRGPDSGETCHGNVYVWMTDDWDDTQCHSDTPCLGHSTREVACRNVVSGELAIDSVACILHTEPIQTRSCESIYDGTCPTYTSQSTRVVTSKSTSLNFPQCSVPDDQLVYAKLGALNTFCIAQSRLPVFANPLPSTCNKTPATFQTTSSVTCGGRYWRLSGWQCIGDGSGVARRSATCVTASDWDQTVPEAECIAVSPMPVLELGGLCFEENAPSAVAELHQYMWQVTSDWGECDFVNCRQERDVNCFNTNTDTTTSRDKCGGFPKPINSRECIDRSKCQQGAQTTGSCTSGELRCIKGYCDWSTGLCNCDTGWVGASCDNMSDCGVLGGYIDVNGNCCVGKITSTGNCCTSGIIDVNGECCSNGSLDACGICNGNGVGVDILGQCCTGLLDYGGTCCSEDEIDRCGVCGGSGLSCYIKLTSVVAAPSQLSSPTSFLQSREGLALFSTWIIDFVAGILNGYALKVELFSAQVSNSFSRRLSEDQMSMKVILGVLPSSTSSLLAIEALELNSNFTSFTMEASGVCGNGLCEARERCNFGQGSGCCPVDCPVSQPVHECPGGCGTQGICLWGIGECSCFRGYAGTQCNECNVGYKKQSTVRGGTFCAPQLASVSALTATRAPSTATIIVNETIVEVMQDNVLPVPLILVVLLLLLVLLLWLRKEHKRRLKKRKGTWVHHDGIIGNDKIYPGNDGKVIVPRRAVLSGWLWKRSRVNLDGHHVWHQWYMAITRPVDEFEDIDYNIDYFDSEKSFRALIAEIDKESKQRWEGTCESELDDVVNEVEMESGSISMKGLLRVEEYPPNPKNLFPIALVFAGTDTETHTLGISDEEVWWGEEHTNGVSGPIYRIKLLTQSRQSQEKWLRRLSRIAMDPVVPLRPPTVNDDEDGMQSLGLATPHEHGGDLNHIGTKSESSLSPFGSSNDGSAGSSTSFPQSAVEDTTIDNNVPEGAFIGSMSSTGNGERISHHGHVHVKVVGGNESSQSKRWRKLHAVLLHNRDDLMFFHSSKVLDRNGTIACWDVKRCVPLKDVCMIKDLGDQGNQHMDRCFELEYHTNTDSQESMYIMSATREESNHWMECLAENLHLKFGRDVVAKAYVGETAPVPPVLDDEDVILQQIELRSQQQLRRSSVSSRRSSIHSIQSGTTDKAQQQQPYLPKPHKSKGQGRGAETSSPIVYDVFQKALTDQQENKSGGRGAKIFRTNPLSDATNNDKADNIL